MRHAVPFLLDIVVYVWVDGKITYISFNYGSRVRNSRKVESLSIFVRVF